MNEILRFPTLSIYRYLTLLFAESSIEIIRKWRILPLENCLMHDDDLNSTEFINRGIEAKYYNMSSSEVQVHHFIKHTKERILI